MLTSWQRRAQAHPRVADTAMALLLFGVSLCGSALSISHPSDRPAWWAGVLASAVGCTALLWQRGRPRTVVAVTTVRAMGASAMGFGLIGMRMTAHSVGGHPHADHRPEGGFEVTAHLPPHPENTEENRTT